MSDTQTPVVEQKTQPPMNQKGPATHEQKQKRRKLIRRVIALTVAVAIVGGSTFLLKKYVFTGNEDGIGEPIHTTVYRSSIMSKVEGSGTAQSKNSATVSPEAGYQVLELFVSEGDFVEEGQLLYNLDDSTAQEGVLTAQNNLLKAQETVDDYNREIAKLRENVANLTITAPHAGKLIDVNNDIKVGDDLGVGTAVATVVNDTKLRLHLYYSWTYEGMVSVGQQARITLPASMSDYPATVEQVNYVKRVVPEGSVMFEVVFVMDNPGTLTEGMTASAALTDGEGNPIYPYQSSTLEYFETTKVAVKVAGPVQSVNLMNYADVTAGQLLVQLGDKDASADIASKQNSLREAQKSVDSAREALEDAQKKLDNFHAVAPISGQVLSCGLVQGEEISSGASIYIADTSTMLVNINIDERNIGYVSKGMMVDLQDRSGNYYMGTIEQIALTAKAEEGVAVFPATVEVANPDGMLMTNTYMSYSFVASQSDDCLVVPVQAVMNVTLTAEQKDAMGITDDNGGTGDGMDGTMTPVDGDMLVIPEGEDGTLPEGDDALPEGGDAGNGEADLTGAGEPAVLPEGEEGIAVDDNVVPRMGSMVFVESVGGVSFDSSRGPSAFKNSDTATVCFVMGEPDERAIPADVSWNMPEGYFAVLVETGLSDESNVEIKSGLNEGDEVFTGYLTNSGSRWD